MRGGIALARVPKRRSASCSATISASSSPSTERTRHGSRPRPSPTALRMLQAYPLIMGTKGLSIDYSNHKDERQGDVYTTMPAIANGTNENQRLLPNHGLLH